MELLAGAGRNHKKRLGWTGRPSDWTDLVTLDINPDHKPDIVHDLTVLPLPIEDNTFEEIHAYEVLEHTGQQGDWRFFFAQFSEFWRIMKPGGMLFGTSPSFSSPWAWGDPGHTRIISQQCLIFLVQTEYEKQVGHTPMTDYRFTYAADFDLLHASTGQDRVEYVLQAVKPSRVRR